MTIAWGAALSKTHLDAATDDPAQARAELEAIIDRINSKLATVTLIQESDLSSGGVNGTVAETSGGGFPNVNADVTATDEELNKLDGVSGSLLSGVVKGVVDATNSGNNDLTEIDFTSISSSATRITVMLDEISLSGNDNVLIQLGDSGGFETSGYSSTSISQTGGGTSVTTRSDGFHFIMAGSHEETGHLILTLIDPSNNTWVASWVAADTAQGSGVDSGGGRKSLSGTLTQVRVTRTGSNTFDNGNLNLFAEDV